MRKFLQVTRGLVVMIALSAGIFFSAATGALAQREWSAISPACVGASGTLSGDVATIQGVACLISNILNVALTILAFVGFIMFVVAAVRLLISGGQSSNLETAKNTITYAIMGLVLAASSFVILRIVASATNAGILSFTFGNDGVVTPDDDD